MRWDDTMTCRLTSRGRRLVSCSIINVWCIIRAQIAWNQQRKKLSPKDKHHSVTKQSDWVKEATLLSEHGRTTTMDWLLLWGPTAVGVCCTSWMSFGRCRTRNRAYARFNTPTARLSGQEIRSDPYGNGTLPAWEEQNRRALYTSRAATKQKDKPSRTSMTHLQAAEQRQHSAARRRAA